MDAMDAPNPTTDLIRIHLSCAVPLTILDLKQQALSAEEWESRLRAVQAENELGFSEGILYRVNGETSRQMGLLTDAVALLSFTPGGCRLFGLLFCAEHFPHGRRQESCFCPRCAGDAQ